MGHGHAMADAGRPKRFPSGQGLPDALGVEAAPRPSAMAANLSASGLSSMCTRTAIDAGVIRSEIRMLLPT